MIVTAMAARPLPPMPMPSDVGMSPAMIADVVMRIGPCACGRIAIASLIGKPARGARWRNPRRNRFLFTNADAEHSECSPQSTSGPSPKRETVRTERHRQRHHDHYGCRNPRLEASTMYTKIIASRDGP